MSSQMYKTLSVFLIASTAITPIALNAEQSFFKDKLPSIVKSIAQGFEDGNAEETVLAPSDLAGRAALNPARQNRLQRCGDTAVRYHFPLTLERLIVRKACSS